MLDNLYSNIGAKIKSWAKWICVVETISAIIGGITLMAEEVFLYGLLCLIIGPIVAFVSTWLLYAFGEITEDIGLMRQKYVGDKVIETQKEYVQPKPKQPTPPTAEELCAAEQAKIRNMWDRWNEEQTSIGRCEVCGTKGQFLVYAEFQENGQTHQKNLCFECFSHRECKPVIHK